jgi:hypothetical protein
MNACYKAPHIQCELFGYRVALYCLENESSFVEQEGKNLVIKLQENNTKYFYNS